MDLATLTTLFPFATELIKRAPELRKWMEKRAKKEDPIFLLQLQTLEAISVLRADIGGLRTDVSGMRADVGDLRTDVGGLRADIGGLRGYTLVTAIMSAMLANPGLTPEEIKEKFIRSAEVARDIVSTVEQVAP